MNEFVGSFWWLIVTIGILVTFHEFGHYIVARWCGVKVLKFSVGFGRSLWSRHDKHGTEFCLAMIPLGGYVKMLDERDDTVTPSERAFAFNRQPVMKRIAIIAAGPIANLLLCIALYWAMFVVGKPDYVPVLGKGTGIAAQAGILEGDIMVEVDGVDTPTHTQLVPPLMLAAIDRRDIEIVLENPQGLRRTAELKLSQLAADFDQTDIYKAIGLVRPTVPPVVTFIAENGAAKGKLLIGDRITKIANIPVNDYADISPIVEKQIKSSPSLAVEIERNGSRLEVMIQAKAVYGEPGLWHKIQRALGFKPQAMTPRWQLGIGTTVPPAKKALLKYGPLESIGKACYQAWDISKNTLAMMKRLLTGAASAKNVSGTITVAQVANQQASTSLGSFFGFLAFFSLSLCIMNLLPIPVLDGGHLLYCLVELVTGNAVAERIQIAGQFIGLAVLASLMLLAHYNDFARLLSN
jgi:regulator of sigma E protease